MINILPKNICPKRAIDGTERFKFDSSNVSGFKNFFFSLGRCSFSKVSDFLFDIDLKCKIHLS